MNKDTRWSGYPEKMRWLFGILLLVVALMGPAIADGPKTAKVKSGDILTIRVVGSPEFSGDSPVLSDGTISGPGIGSVKVAGKTLDQAKKAITEALSKRLKDPFVDVFFKLQKPEVVYVVNAALGKTDATIAANPGVVTPQTIGGVVPLIPGANLNMILSGIPLNLAPDRLDVIVSRDSKIALKATASDVLRPGSSESFFVMQADDIVTIAMKPYVRVWVIGIVPRPGEYVVAEGADAYQAIADAGGITETSTSEYTIKLRRGPETKVLTNNASEGHEAVLMPGDVVFVERVPTARVRIMGEISNPNEYLFSGKTSILSAIARAGGLNSIGTLRDVLVMRGSQMYRFDLSKIVKGENPPEFDVQDRDLIYVMRNERTISVHGKVEKAGVFPIPDGVTYRVSDVIALSGGVRDSGSLRRISLARAGKDGKITVRTFSLDDYLKSGKQDANPVLQAGDMLLVGSPRSLIVDDLNRLLSPLLILDALLKRR